MESERGWGKSEWTEDYDTRQEAYDRIVEVNSRNTATHAPDYYVQAYTDIVPVYIPKHRKDV
jgi:hypothetical protein